MALKYPILSEKGVYLVQKSNTLVFIVDMSATKKQIREELEKNFNVKVGSVRTMVTLDGVKKAYVRLKEGKAEDVAAKYGLI